MKLQRIDESLIHDHPNLTMDDSCYFFGEYASGQGYSYGEVNQLINNLKKPMTRKTLKEWVYKEKAIERIAEIIVQSNSWEKLKHYTWVPVPPSKEKSDPLYDNRLSCILQKLSGIAKVLDQRELLLTRKSREASHEPGNKRPTCIELMNNLYLNENITKPPPRGIIIFDDVITTGASFKAAYELLRRRYHEAKIIGIFIARSIRKN